jgi:transcriptional regulator with XRE-family HTH domain
MVFMPPERIIQALKNRGYSQRRIAELAGITPAQVSRILRGERGTTLDTYVALYALWETVVKGGKDGD